MKLSVFDNKNISVQGDIILHRSCSEIQIHWHQLASKTFKIAFKKDNSIGSICKEQFLTLQSGFGGYQKLHKSWKKFIHLQLQKF